MLTKELPISSQYFDALENLEYMLSERERRFLFADECVNQSIAVLIASLQSKDLPPSDTATFKRLLEVYGIEETIEPLGDTEF